MKKLIIASILSVAALTGTAFAHEHEKGHHDKGEHKGKHQEYMVNEKMEKMDLNKDGSITLEESQEAAKTMFNEADANKDGKVSREEVTAQIEKKMKEKHAEMKELKEKHKAEKEATGETKVETKTETTKTETKE